MVSPKNWWLGFIPLTLLCVIANWTSTEKVETDLAVRSGIAVSKQKSISSIDQWSLDVTGRDVTIIGNAFDPEAGKQLENTVMATSGVRLVNNSIKNVAEAKPYVWSATKEASSISFNGSIPSPSVRAALSEHSKALFLGIDVKDQMNYAVGSPNKFTQMIDSAIQALSKMSNGTALISDDKLSITGTASNSAAYENILGLIGTKSNDVGFGKIDVRPPASNPYLYAAKLDGSLISLSGAIVSVDARNALLSSAKAIFRQTQIIDHLSYASSSLPNMSDAISQGMLSLSSLVEGELTIKDNIVTLVGRAPPGSDPQQVKRQLASVLPAGFSISASSAIVATAVEPIFSATKVNGVLTLDGVFPDDKTHQSILEAIAQQFFAEKVVDNLVNGPVKLQNFETAIIDSLRQLSRLANGSLVATDTYIQLKGEAYYPNALKKITENLKNLPVSSQMASSINVKETEPSLTAEACQAMLQSVLEKGTIRFEIAKATIDQDSSGILDVIVASVMRCPAASFEVSGHTDSDGNDQANLELSQRRAKAVVDYFAEAGVNPVNLAAVGYGATRPVASNETKEGKAKNRRIEFQIR